MCKKTKLISIILILSFMMCQTISVFAAAYVNGGDTKYMYNGVIIASNTYECTSETEGGVNLWWTVYDESKGAREWPATLVIKGNLLYDSHQTGAKLCRFTVGNTYDIRLVFVHSSTQQPYYYLMIEGAGITNLGITGEYTDGVWISKTRTSNSGKVTTGDGISTLQNGYTLDHVTVTDGDENPDKFYNNHADFRNVEYRDGAIVAELLWTPDPESINAENIRLTSGGNDVEIDKFDCDGNKIFLYSKGIIRGETYTVCIGDTTKTALGSEIRIPLKTEYTVPYNDTDITSAAFSENSFTLNARNLTGDDFRFTVLIALKSDEGITEEIIVSDEYCVSAGKESEDITIENLDFKSLTPEAYIVKSAAIPVPVSDRSYK